MDGIVITAAVILAAVALIEVVTLFLARPDPAAPPYIELLPVFGEDRQFPRRIEYLGKRCGGRTSLIIVDISANEQQLELCRRLAEESPDTVIVTMAELEGALREIFLLRNG
ncbi:MAG: hypothetical protein IJ071_12815 [Ruminococcus sp.]|nr:hypothetical protein [Ruminococcus sp.]